MERSESLDMLAPALAKAQALIKDAEKSRQNPHLKSQYATLSDVWEAARKPLTDNGLSVSQGTLTAEPGTLALRTILLHSSGQFLSSDLCLPVVKADAQGYGSAITYARRYAFSAMVGVCSADDDGEGAGKADEKPQQRTQGQQRVAEANQKQERGTYAENTGLKTMPLADVRKTCAAMLGELGVQDLIDGKKCGFHAFYVAWMGRDEGKLNDLSEPQWRAFLSALQASVTNKKACFAIWPKISDSKSDEDRYVCWGSYVGREIKSSSELTPQEWVTLRAKLNEIQQSNNATELVEGDPFQEE